MNSADENRIPPAEEGGASPADPVMHTVRYSSHAAADPHREWTTGCTIALYIGLKRGDSLLQLCEEMNRDLPTIIERTRWLLTHLQKTGDARLQRILKQRAEYRSLLGAVGALAAHLTAVLLWQIG